MAYWRSVEHLRPDLGDLALGARAGGLRVSSARSGRTKRAGHGQAAAVHLAADELRQAGVTEIARRNGGGWQSASQERAQRVVAELCGAYQVGDERGLIAVGDDGHGGR